MGVSPLSLRSLKRSYRTECQITFQRMLLLNCCTFWLMIGKRGVDGVVGVSKQEDAAKLFRDKETYTPCYQFVLKFVFVVGIGCRK